MMRAASALVAIALIAGCADYAPTPAGSLSMCLMAHEAFSREVDAAIAARANDPTGALLHSQAAQMNLDILLEKKCCRFSETCPALVYYGD